MADIATLEINTDPLIATLEIQAVLNAGDGGGGTWGSITGTLSDQTDLTSALAAKQATITGGASTITTTDLTASRALVSTAGGKVGTSTVTTTELAYLSGVTSAVQTQISARATSENASLTGTATVVNLTSSGIIDTGTTGSLITESLQVRSTLDDLWTTFSADALTANRILNIPDETGTIATREWAANDAAELLLDSDFNVVCEGDSITEGNHVTSTTTWPYLFGNMEFCSGRATVTNVGLNGGTIASITTDYSTQVYPYRPAATGKRAILCVQIGTNDYATVASATWLASWASYMATARADGFILVAFTATGRTSDTVAQRATRIAYNAGIRASAAWDYLVDLDALLPVHSDTTYYSDGTHPTAEGNRVIAAEVTATLLGQRFLGPYSAYTRFEFDSAGNGFTPTFANFTINLTGATTITSTVDNQVLEVTRTTTTGNAVRNIAMFNAICPTGVSTGFGAVVMFTIGTGSGQTNMGQIGVRMNSSGSNYGTAVIRLATAGTIADTWTCDHSGNTTQAGSVSAASLFASSPTAGIGYTTGAGGTVTQATSRTTGVTINKVCGSITLVSAAGSASWQSFTVTNSTVAATDTVRVCQKSGTDKYMAHVTAVGSGSFQITYATTGGTTTEQPVFNFAIIKGVAA